MISINEPECSIQQAEKACLQGAVETVQRIEKKVASHTLTLNQRIACAASFFLVVPAIYLAYQEYQLSKSETELDQAVNKLSGQIKIFKEFDATNDTILRLAVEKLANHKLSKTSCFYKEVEKYTLSSGWSAFWNTVTLGTVPWIYESMREGAVSRLNKQVISDKVEKAVEGLKKKVGISDDKLYICFALMKLSPSEKDRLLQISKSRFFDSFPKNFKTLCENLQYYEEVKEALTGLTEESSETYQFMKPYFGSKDIRDKFVRLFDCIDDVKINLEHIENACGHLLGVNLKKEEIKQYLLNSLIKPWENKNSYEGSYEIIDTPAHRAY